MTRDELREEIGKTDLPLRNKIVLLLAEANTSEPPVTCYDVSNSLISLLAPVLADAERWRVMEKEYPNICARLQYNIIVDALDGKEAPDAE
jgi:hypothetical protein